MQVVEFIKNPKYKAIQYDGINLETLRLSFQNIENGIEFKESNFGLLALFINLKPASEIIVGDYILQEIDNPKNTFVVNATLFIELFKTI